MTNLYQFPIMPKTLAQTRLRGFVPAYQVYQPKTDNYKNKGDFHAKYSRSTHKDISIMEPIPQDRIFSIQLNRRNLAKHQPDSERWRQKLNLISERFLRDIETTSDRLELGGVERTYMYMQICLGLQHELRLAEGRVADFNSKFKTTTITPSTK